RVGNLLLRWRTALNFWGTCSTRHRTELAAGSVLTAAGGRSSTTGTGRNDHNDRQRRSTCRHHPGSLRIMAPKESRKAGFATIMSTRIAAAASSKRCGKEGPGAWV